MSVQSGHTEPEGTAGDRRIQILEVALKLFAERGVEGTTIKQIAERADISVGLLYHYFDGKAALLQAIFEHRALKLPQLEEMHHQPVEEVLPLFAQSICDDLRENIEIVWIFFREQRSSPMVSEQVERKRQRCAQSLSGYLQSRQQTGELRDFSPEIAARMLLGALFSSHLTETPHPETISAMVDIFIKGIKS